MSQINVNIVAPESGTDVTVDGNLIVTGTNNIRPYKIYSAILNQSGTNAPTAIVLLDEIGITGFSYIGPGIYNITSSGGFTTDQTSIDGNNVDYNNGDTIAYRTGGTGFCQISTRTFAGVQANDILFKNFIEIRVYN
jgi:hypothetical protein